MPGAQTVIIIAHKRFTKPLIKLIEKRREILDEYRLLATKETGEAIEAALDMEVTHVFAAKKGGETQLAGLVCSNTIRAVIFLRDPLNTDPAEADITPFYRVCDLNNVPLATNLVAANAIIQWLGRHVEEDEENQGTADGAEED